MTHALWVDRAASAYGHGSDGRGGGWPGLRQVVHVRATREPVQAGLDVIVEDHYYLTSLACDKPKGRPKALLALARSHWEIENCLHHAKDRSLGEDADRTKAGATIMARMRSMAIGLLDKIPGKSVPQKQIDISSNPNIALRLFSKKYFRQIKTRL